MSYRAWRVHRFRDAVAVSVPNLPTFYLNVAAAGSLAEALQAAAADIHLVPFADSELASVDAPRLAKTVTKPAHAVGLKKYPET